MGMDIYLVNMGNVMGGYIYLVNMGRQGILCLLSMKNGVGVAT